MTDIDISGIESGQRSAEELQEELETRKAEERERLEAIRAQILEGESTGDLLKDLVIVRTHRLDEETVELYRDLSARVAAHVGEPVLVIGRDERRTSFGGPHKRSKESGTIDTNTALGVLTGESLQLDIPDGSWKFPTDRYAFRSDQARGDGPSVIDEPLGTEKCLGMISLFARNSYEGVLGQKLDLQYDHFSIGRTPAPIQLEVYVGRAEIEAHLDTEFDDYMGHHQHRTRWYNELAELLDLPKRSIVSDETFMARHQEREATRAAAEDQPTN